MLFPLPNLSARADILRIHTRQWAQPPSPQLVEDLASLCVGYCGADLKVLQYHGRAGSRGRGRGKAGRGEHGGGSAVGAARQGEHGRGSSAG